jgi:hypothetical protein
MRWVIGVGCQCERVSLPSFCLAAVRRSTLGNNLNSISQLSTPTTARRTQPYTLASRGRVPDKFFMAISAVDLDLPILNGRPVGLLETVGTHGSFSTAKCAF